MSVKIPAPAKAIRDRRGFPHQSTTYLLKGPVQYIDDDGNMLL